MSSSIFKSWKDGQRQTLRWIEFDEYARRVFAGEREDWLRNPVGFVSDISQTLGVISTEVLSIDAFAPFAATVAAESHDDPVVFANTLLDEAAPLSFIDEVINALSHRYAGSIDLVLKLPVPRDFLLACGAQETTAEDFDNLDDIGLCLCNFVRRYAEKNIDGILLTSQSAAGLSADETDAYGPVFAAARHYDWYTGLALASSTIEDSPEIDCDIFLYPYVSSGLFVIAGARSTGGGLPADFWLGRESLACDDKPFAFYGVIPPDARPEDVIERIKELESV